MLDPPFRTRKTKSIMDMNDMDIPIYNWRKENFVGLPENKNLRQRTSIGSKK